MVLGADLDRIRGCPVSVRPLRLSPTLRNPLVLLPPVELHGQGQGGGERVREKGARKG